MADLQRFLDAQAGAYARALYELRAGEKRSHWIWYVLPQIQGLGSSSTAQRYAIADRAEAAAYVAHEVLGARLRECVAAILQHRGRTARQILGTPDDLKFRSCLTLFREVAPEEPLFQAALDAFYQGEPDARTLAILEGALGPR